MCIKSWWLCAVHASFALRCLAAAVAATVDIDSTSILPIHPHLLSNDAEYWCCLSDTATAQRSSFPMTMKLPTQQSPMSDPIPSKTNTELYNQHAIHYQHQHKRHPFTCPATRISNRIILIGSVGSRDTWCIDHLKSLKMNWGADNLANVVGMRNQSASDMGIDFSSTCCCDEKEWSAPSKHDISNLRNLDHH